jgi:hypothetical protein
VTERIKIGRSMEDALQVTADRLNMPEFSFFCITLAIQRETGGNLAETLANLADVLRKRAQMKLKIKAMSSESKASAYIVGSLPFIVFVLVYWVNPGYLAGFFSDQRLIITGLGGLCGWAWAPSSWPRWSISRSEGHMDHQIHNGMLFGVDVVWVGTLLAVVAAGLMIGVIYMALTIRDPMAKRVKALNERREELKAGIVAINPKKRAQLVRRSEATDRIRTILNRINGLQDSQIQAAQQSWRRPASARRKWPLR